MIAATESLSVPSSDTTPTSDVAYECDRCGQVVHRETARQWVVPSADGGEIVTLCSECEFGDDS